MSKQWQHKCAIGSNFPFYVHMGVSLNGGTPKSSILIGFSMINHPFWSTPIFGNTHIIEDGYQPNSRGLSYTETLVQPGIQSLLLGW